MRLMLAGDTHGFINQVYWLTQKAEHEGCDRIFQLGDFGAWEHMAKGRLFFDQIETIATKSGIKWYFLDGNHDKSSLIWNNYHDRTEEGFRIVRNGLYYADRGMRWEWEGRKFMAFGGAYSVDKDYRLELEAEKYLPPGSMWFPEEEATDEDVERIIQEAAEDGWNEKARLDVLLTHDKPITTNPFYNRKDWTEIPECAPNQRRVQRLVRAFKPKLLVHGHLHLRYTEEVRCGDDNLVTRVDGLQADPEAGGHIPGYNRLDSYLVLNVTQPGTDPDLPEREVATTLEDTKIDDNF